MGFKNSMGHVIMTDYWMIYILDPILAVSLHFASPMKIAQKFGSVNTFYILIQYTILIYKDVLN